MSDSYLFANSNGVSNLMASMQLIANNLSNVNTAGFHADYRNILSQKAHSNEEDDTQIPVDLRNGIYTDPKQGPINYTGRELDVAIEGRGYIAVQTKRGETGYTRTGSLNITPEGLLVTSKGDIVLGNGGIINVPPSSKVTIDKHGVVSAQLAGQPGISLAEIGRISLVDIPSKSIQKEADGLYYPNENFVPVPSNDITLATESLEGSNVDVIRCLTDLIECSRQFDMRTKNMKTADDNAIKANQLLNIQT